MSKMTQEDFERAVTKAAADQVAELLPAALDKRLSEVAADLDGKTADQIAADKVLSLFAPMVNRKQSERDERPAHIRAGALIRAMMSAECQRSRAADIAKEWGDTFTEKALRRKSLTTSDFGSGGAFVPDDVFPAFFESIKPRSILRAAGATVIQMVNGRGYIPGVTGGATATIGAEGSTQNATTITSGRVTLQSQRLMAILIVSNEMLNAPSANADEVIGNEAVREVARAEDAFFLSRIFDQVAAANVTASAAASALAAKNEVKSLRKVIRGANFAQMATDLVYLTTTDIAEDLAELHFTDLRVFPEMDQGRIRSAPFFSGNNVAAGKLGCFDRTELFIGQDAAVTMEMFRGGNVKDSAGNDVSLISSNQSALRIVTHVDAALRRDGAGAIKTGVNFAAL